MSNERLEVLGGLPLFEPLSPDERERLAAGCRMRAFARGATLFREGERADGMHIVLRGVVKVVRFAPDGREMVLHLVRKGNTIGEAAMFQKGTFPCVRRGRGRCGNPVPSGGCAVHAGDGKSGDGLADARGAVASPADVRAQAGCAGAGRCGLPGLPRICCTEGRLGVGTASGSGFPGKCSPICSDWPVKRFPASCPGSPRRVWSS